jgi:hypothetical protein
VARRWSLVLLVVALAGGCTAPTERDRAAPAPPTSTTEATTTTTTVPVAPDIADLMVTTTMTDRARRIFLAADPAVEDLATFSHSCGVDTRSAAPGEPRTHTQGCFASGQIHLLAPDRADAHDLLYVVAAHELLHAVYAALTSADRTKVDAEVEAARAGNDRLEERLKPYGATPTLDNEIHSILGSEFDGLSPTLEAHYAQFFTNRAVLVAARKRTLGTREDEMRRLKAEIDELGSRIDTLRSTQTALRASGDIRTYNANLPVVNGLISQYNDDVDVLNARIDEYNSLLGA